MSNTLLNAGKPSHSLVAQGQNNSFHQCYRLIKFQPHNLFISGGPGIYLIHSLIVRTLLLSSSKSLASGKHLHWLLWNFFTGEIVANSRWEQLEEGVSVWHTFQIFSILKNITFLCNRFTSIPHRSNLPHFDCWKLFPTVNLKLMW